MLLISWFSGSAPTVLGGGPTTYPGRDYPGLLGITRGFPHTFFRHLFCTSFFTSVWELLGTLLASFWDRFWKGFGIENDANNDLNENVKIVFSLKRKHNFEGSGAPKNHHKIHATTSSKQVSKMEPNFGSKLPT